MATHCCHYCGRSFVELNEVAEGCGQKIVQRCLQAETYANMALSHGANAWNSFLYLSASLSLDHDFYFPRSLLSTFCPFVDLFSERAFVGVVYNSKTRTFRGYRRWRRPL